MIRPRRLWRSEIDPGHFAARLRASRSLVNGPGGFNTSAPPVAAAKAAQYTAREDVDEETICRWNRDWCQV